jgi:Ni/Fe-hydrogenase 1 B-type cytochrome subunit
MSTENFADKISPISFNQIHSLPLRIWHWVTSLAITATLITVFLASTLFKTKNNIAMVQEQLQQKGVTVSADQARSVAHEYNDKLWDTHKVIGYVISFLLITRMIIEITQPSEQKMKMKIKNASGFRSDNIIEKNEQKHYLFVKRTYLFFYAAILIMAVTGLVLASPWLKDFQRTIRSIHSFVQYIIYGYIVIHLAGVIFAEGGKYKGVVSGMIHGNKK